jgi:multiple sugar transport system substrate-binding protein
MDSASIIPGMNRRTLLSLGALGAAAVALGACSNNPAATGPVNPDDASGAVDIAFWGTQDQTTATLGALKAFETAAPKIKVNSQYGPYEGYFDKLATRVAGGSAPDIFQIDLPYLASYASKGRVRALDDYASLLALDTLPSSLQGISKSGGKSYFALVGAITQPGMAYNSDMLGQYSIDAPAATWTFDDLQQACAKVVDASGGKVFGTNDFGGAVVAVESYMHGRGKALYTDAGGLGFDESDMTAWLTLWKTFRDSKLAPPMSVTAAAAGFQDYPIVKGQSAYSQIPTARGVAALQALTKSPIKLATFPKVANAKVAGTTVVPVAIWAVSAKSKNPGAAIKLLSYLANSPDAATALGIQGGVPLNKAGRDALTPKLNDGSKAIVAQYDAVSGGDLYVIQPQPASANQVLSANNSALVKANQSVGFGKASVDQAVTEFFSTARKVLGK